MRRVLFIATLLLLPTGASAQRAETGGPPTNGANADNRRFDGKWDVTLDCPTHTDGAFAYTYRFVAAVQDGALRGENGIEGRPSWLLLTGTIQPDGSARLDARGLTGDPEYTVKRAFKSLPYRYHVDARFEGTRGSGRRIELRRCDLHFAKQ